MPSLKQLKTMSSKDDMCYLISKTYTFDELKQEIETENEYEVFCSRMSIGQKEFSVSFQNGLKSEMIILIDHDEYDGQNELKYNGQHYSIYRTFVREDGDIELYCVRRVGD